MSRALPSTELPFMLLCFLMFFMSYHIACTVSTLVRIRGGKVPPTTTSPGFLTDGEPSSANVSPAHIRTEPFLLAIIFAQKVASTFYDKHFSIKMVRTEPFPQSSASCGSSPCDFGSRFAYTGTEHSSGKLCCCDCGLYDIIVVCMIQHDATRRHIQKKRRGQANAAAAYHLTLTLPQLFFFIWRRVISCHIIKTAPNTGHAGPPPCW